MNSRQRGALIVFAVLAAGRVLDRFDLPFERRAPGNGMPPDSTLVPGAPPVAPGMERVPPEAGPAERGPEGAAHGPDAGAPGRRPRGAATAPEIVHINHAAAPDLQRLPGVGPVLAARILEHRRTHGPFRDLAGLRQVKGIGARTAERLSSWIRFD